MAAAAEQGGGPSAAAVPPPHSAAGGAGALAEGKRFAAISREGALVFNNVMLSAILAVVLLGTLYPLRHLRMQDNKLGGNFTDFDTLGNLRQLVTLDLYNNKLTGKTVFRMLRRV